MKKFALSTTVLASLAMMVGVASAAAPAGAANQSNMAHTNFHIKMNATTTYQSGLTPIQMTTAYGLTQLPNNGAGQTIAIVDASGSSTITQDLNTFDTQFGLPAANLTVHKMSILTLPDSGWALETSLDVEWAHALAPAAKILLVEASTASTSALLSAIDYATSQGAVVVSNSWGGSETSTEASLDSHFQHNGTVYVASSGDTGGQLEWPAVSPYVLSVGGTNLSVNADNSYSSESAWSSAGGGKSVYESTPSYQSGVTGVVGTSRGVPDVAMDADPASGVAVYDSTSYNGTSGWWVVGGTSLSAPMMSAVVALADQNRTTKLTSFQAIADLYNMPSSNFHDITTGSNGNPALPGYDLVTGLGTPVANNLIPAWTTAP